ncbi:MAG: NTP transferase domain-containing protein, partial [Deltaproteobacteria bacterium]|nr:NTP transferase domain-containing protein [Deltaproteobacteria bacterium]
MSREKTVTLAMVLSAGFGERLKPLSLSRPKPLFPVLNRPMLGRWFDKLAAAGVGEVVVNAHHLKEMIADFVGREREKHPGLTIRLSVEDDVLGTGGGLKRAGGFLDRTFYCVNADILTDLRLKDLAAFHFDGEKDLTLAALDNPAKATVSVGADGRILGFREKAPLENETAKLFGTGVMVMEPRILGKIPDGPSDIVDTLRAEAEAGRDMRVFRPRNPEPFWTDVGTPEDYYRANLVLSQGMRHLEEGAEILGETSGFLVAEAGALTEKGSLV